MSVDLDGVFFFSICAFPSVFLPHNLSLYRHHIFYLSSIEATLTQHICKLLAQDAFDSMRVRSFCSCKKLAWLGIQLTLNLSQQIMLRFGGTFTTLFYDFCLSENVDTANYTFLPKKLFSGLFH